MLRISPVKYLFSLHPYLKRNLQRLNLEPLTPMQQEVLALSNDKSNILINQNTGSGKTLSYLVPLLNNILTNKRVDKDQPWGGLVLTLTKQLGIQIYRQVRLLDPDNLIKISRIGSIAHFSGIVEKLNKKQETAANLDELVKENVINTINWSNWDIVVSTPHSLVNAVGKQKNLLKPQLVVIDEADMLLGLDQNIGAITKEIIKRYLPRTQKPQYILASSSFPPKMLGIESKKFLTSMFEQIKVVESPSKHRLPPTLKVLSVDSSLFQGKTKDDVFLEILQDNLSKDSRVIVFCNSSKTVEDTTKFLSTKQIKNSSLTATMSTQSRAETISSFQRKDFSVLVATNLASRGLDLNVDLIIEYNMATNVVDYMNRAGRTARFGKDGTSSSTSNTVISFVEEEDKMLFNLIREKLESGEPMDDAFSRKRSLSKTMKKYENDSDL